MKVALLKQAGYRTGFVGKFGVEVDPRAPERMFDFYRLRTASSTSSPYYRKAADGTVKHITTINGDDAVEFIRTCQQDQPFCLSVSFSAPHPEDDNIRQYIYDTKYEDLYQNAVNWGMHLTPDGPISCGLPLPQPAREGNHPAEVVGPTPEAHCASWRHGGG